MKKVLLFAVFALSFSLMSSLLMVQVNAWTPQWEQTWGGSALDSINGVAVARDGSIYAVGHTYSFGTGGPGDADALILKYGQSGGLVWEMTWGGAQTDRAEGVAVDPLGGYLYVVGYTLSFGQGSSDAFILKLDDTGPNPTLEWALTWGGPSYDEAQDVAVWPDLPAWPDRLIYVVGYTGSFGMGVNDAFILRFDQSGSLVWQQTWGGSGSDGALALALGFFGLQIFVVGYTDSFIACNSFDAFIVRFDKKGNLKGQWTWGDTGDECAWDVAISGGGIFVAGDTTSYGAGGFDAFLLRLNLAGGLIWDRTWGGAQTDYGIAVVGSGNSIFVVGETSSFLLGGSVSGYAVEFNPGGVVTPELAWGGLNPNEAVWTHDAALDPTANMIYAAGRVYAAGPSLFPLSYLTPVGGTVTTPGDTLVPVSGAVTPTSVILGTPSGIVGTPSGNTAYVGGRDTYLIKIAP